MHGPELRALRPLQGASPYVFVTEAGTPVTTAWFLRMVQRTGRAASFAFAAQTTNLWMTSAAITLGVAIPALVYALMRVGAALYIDCHSKA